jgi:hypothetical protein
MKTICYALRIFALIAALFTVFTLPAPAQSNNSRGSTTTAQEQPNTDQKAQRSLVTPLRPQLEDVPYEPITARQRLRWFITNPLMPSHLLGGGISSALGTAMDRPKEYGPHWGGFADRFAMRMPSIIVGNAMEASLGTITREDPRYFRVPDKSFGARVKNVVKQTFEARRPDGNYAPAYARYTAYAGSNFLSNEWRVDSESNVHDAVLRTGEGFIGKMAGNAFAEFWPDVERRLLHRNR